MFRARLPSIFTTLSPLHAALTMPFAQNEPQDTSKVLRLPRKSTMISKVLPLPGKMQRIFWKRRKSIALATQNDFPHVTKHVWMSRSATLATRNEATRRLKPPKMTPFAELTIRPSRGRLRTVADGCGRLRTVADGCGRLRTVADGCGRKHNVERTHPQPPVAQNETGTLATHSGKKRHMKAKCSNLEFMLTSNDLYSQILVAQHLHQDLISGVMLKAV